MTMLGNISCHQPLPTNGDQPVASSAYINRSLTKWLLGCAISPYVRTPFVFICSHSVFNPINHSQVPQSADGRSFSQQDSHCAAVIL
jgi:hypothetical protein